MENHRKLVIGFMAVMVLGGIIAGIFLLFGRSDSNRPGSGKIVPRTQSQQGAPSAAKKLPAQPAGKVAPTPGTTPTQTNVAPTQNNPQAPVTQVPRNTVPTGTTTPNQQAPAAY